MTTCKIYNSNGVVRGELYCDHGCCGTSIDQQCCDYTLSDTVIIVACVVGGLLVVGVVVVLIICIKNSKKQDRVVRIRATRRTLEPPRRRIELPKPPPYTELPPDYSACFNGNIYHIGDQGFAGSAESGYSSTHSQGNSQYTYPMPIPSTSDSMSSFDQGSLRRLVETAPRDTRQPPQYRRVTRTRIPRRTDASSSSSTRAASTSTAGLSVSTMESQLPGVPANDGFNTSIENSDESNNANATNGDTVHTIPGVTRMDISTVNRAQQGASHTMERTFSDRFSSAKTTREININVTSQIQNEELYEVERGHSDESNNKHKTYSYALRGANNRRGKGVHHLQSDDSTGIKNTNDNVSNSTSRSRRNATRSEILQRLHARQLELESATSSSDESHESR